MRHRIYLPRPFAAGEAVEISGDEFHHAVRVVRAREGEEVELFDGKGAMAAARIVSIGRDSATARVEALLPSRESRVDLHLAMSIIQLDRFELVLQKATELGARSILPMITDRAEVRPERYRGKGERWEKIVFEAVKQSGRGVVPELLPPSPFDTLIARPGVKLFFDADEPPSPPVGELTDATLFVGPEGGWSGREVALARSAGCLFARLGPRRLRAETAAIVAIVTATARSGELC